MSTSSTSVDISCCIYCNKECKNSESRPYPTSKNKTRIHNKCKIKKSLEDKNNPSNHNEKEQHEVQIAVGKATSNISSLNSILERAAKEDVDMEKMMLEKKLSKLVADQNRTTSTSSTNSSFFFDLKAGVAQEKRRYLHHKNLSEIVTRYDDNGFQDEPVGRTYDHSGKDLNTLGDESDTESDDKIESKTPKRNTQPNAPKKIKLDDKNPCWFCLSSPLVEKHLIIAIGEFCYLALAKGGLLDVHLLLVPIDHIDCLNDSSGNTKELLEELEALKKSLIAYFQEQGKGVVFFERNFKSVHWQLQVVPIPLDLLPSLEESIKTISKKHFSKSNYMNIPTDCKLGDIIPPRAPYFYWQLEPIGSRFVTQIHVKDSFFPVQLGRMVLADSKILKCHERIDWKRCVKNKDEYTQLVKTIKDSYRKFDIT